MSIKTVLGLRNSQENSRHSHSLSDASFYIPDDLISSINPTMKQFDTSILQQQRRRQQVRIDHHDGPWSLSVADTPHQLYSFTIYIKSTFTFSLSLSLTFNLTLSQLRLITSHSLAQQTKYFNYTKNYTILSQV